MIQIEAFDGREALTDAAANALSERLTQGGLLVVAGGSTPRPVYDRLSGRDLPWSEVTVTLTDERQVDSGSDDSNEKMVRARLLTAKAAAAPFLPLRSGRLEPLAEAAAAGMRVATHLPAAAVLLGMGADGHVASLFPNTPELAAGLDLDGEALCLPVARAGLAPFVPRLTLTARALTQTRLLILLISGDDKRALIERIGREETYAPPAATFLRQDRCPVRVLWAA
jgi:6-phosphogluconolactonase